ncbi:CapA family protein [Paenibacillus sp. FA6]|uniref:CapA family protein n=1 Tax=Paenibacillus sp. FA6 TaxID=3413029 RepID=UPI003F65E7EE
MQLSRSNKNRSTRKKKNRRFRKSWVLLNAFLVSMIVVLLSYHWITEGKQAKESEAIAIESPVIEADKLGAEIEPTTPKAVEQDQISKNETPKKADVTKPVTKANEPVEPDDSNVPKDSTKPDNSAELEAPIESDDSSQIIANSDSILTFNFAGDMMFAGKVEGMLKEKGYDYPFEHLGELFHNDDLTIANLETPVTTSGVEAINKQYVFKSSPKALDALKKAGMDAVGLANNHILDQGVPGLLDTLKYLGESGIQYAGAGKNADEAYAPTYFTRQGVKIALIAVSRVVPDKDWHAGKGKPGVATVYNPDEALKSIATARTKADIVIVMAHWGKEKELQPIKNQTELAHQFVDAGADLVIGAHPHVLQGLEQYKGKWIAYSTGNFIFTKSSTASTWKTAIFATTCTPKGDCKIKLIPFHTEVGQPVPMSDTEGQQLFQDIEKLSIGGVKINKDGTVVMPKS